MGEGTWEYIGGAILIIVVLILIVLIAFPMLREGKSDVINIYEKVFGLERPEEEVLKEKNAIETFNKFLEQLDMCLKLGESDCTCDFELTNLGDRKIIIDETSKTEVYLENKDGTRFSSELKDLIFGVADEEGCGLIGQDDKGYKISKLFLEKNNLKLVYENNKNGFKEDFPKLYVKKLPKNKQLCFIIGGYEKYEDKVSCEDVPKKRAVEERGDKVVKTLFNQLDDCLNKGNKDCTCDLSSIGLKPGEDLRIRIGDAHYIHLVKDGFISELTRYTFNFKIAEGDEQKKECKDLSLSSIYYQILLEGDRFYLKKVNAISKDFLEKGNEIYISSNEDENTICFLKEGDVVPPAC